jgi:hypothetical protein
MNTAGPAVAAEWALGNRRRSKRAMPASRILKHRSTNTVTKLPRRLSPASRRSTPARCGQRRTPNPFRWCIDRRPLFARNCYRTPPRAKSRTAKREPKPRRKRKSGRQPPSARNRPAGLRALLGKLRIRLTFENYTGLFSGE